MRRSRQVLAALGLSLLLHVSIISLISWRQASAPSLVPEAVPAPPAPGLAPASATAPSAATPVEIALVDPEAVDLRIGPIDSDALSEHHPNPRADVDSPDRAPASVGGGDPRAGRPTFTGRSDPGDDAMTVAATTGATALRTEHTRTGRERRSPETIRREPAPGVADTRGTGRTAKGPLLPRAGSAADTRPAAQAPAPGPLSDDDPMIARRTGSGGDAAAETAAERTRSAAGAAPVAPGPRATETDQRGATSDDLAVAEASDRKQPGVIERTPPSARGEAESGVVGARAPGGTSARSPRPGSAQGGTRADVPYGDDPALRARRTAQTEYLRRLRRKVDRIWEYPDELRIGLEQGSVLVQVTLRARDGALVGVRFMRHSRFKAFDREVQRALEQAAPFGPVPGVLTSGDVFTLSAPFEYANPLIR